MYTREVKLKHDEIAASINIETGEIKELSRRPNNLPDGKSKLDCSNFSIINRV